MKITLKSLSLLLSALLTVSVSYSCRKSSDAEPAVEAPADVTPLTVTGRIGGADTKVTYTLESSKISQKWAVGDTIIGIDNASTPKTYTYVVSKVNSDGTASFTFVKGGSDSRYGTATDNPSDGTTMYMIYAPGYAASNFISNSLTIDISTQDTTTIGTKSASGLHIPAIMTASGTVSSNKLSLTFANQLELLMITDPTLSGCATGTSISSFTVSGSDLPTTATFGASGFTVDSESGDTVTKNCSLTTDSDGKASGTVLIALLPASSQNLIIKSSNSYADTITSHTPTASSLLKVSGATFDTLRSVLLNGKFTVSSTGTGKQVQFTKGNLYWDGNAFHIEENQTGYPTSWDANYVGHFYWTTLTDYQSGTASYMPYAESYSYSSQSTSDKFWCGEDNPLTVDGQSNLYALSKDEWNHLIKTRTNASNLYKYGVTVTNGGTSYTNCLIIAPDDYDFTTTPLLSSYTLDDVNASSLVCLPAAGTRKEEEGGGGGGSRKPRLVCLPAAGYLDGNTLYDFGSFGFYRSSTLLATNAVDAYYLVFCNNYVDPEGYNNRDRGYSVRLVYTVPTN